MPIRKENRNRYPKDWKEISARIRERDNNRCKWCGIPDRELGGRDLHGEWHAVLEAADGRSTWPEPGTWWRCVGYPHALRIIRIVLTTAHLDHTPENCDDDNLVSLCQQCHLRYDAPMHHTGMKERRASQSGRNA